MLPNFAQLSTLCTLNLKRVDWLLVLTLYRAKYVLKISPNLNVTYNPAALHIEISLLISHNLIKRKVIHLNTPKYDCLTRYIMKYVNGKFHNFFHWNAKMTYNGQTNFGIVNMNGYVAYTWEILIFWLNT